MRSPARGPSGASSAADTPSCDAVAVASGSAGSSGTGAPFCYDRDVRVIVVGAGVAGLTTAIELEARGHDVEVVAAARGDAITSSVAGAVWFPYRAGESPRVLDWAHRTRERLTALAADPATGVDLLTFYECADDD